MKAFKYGSQWRLGRAMILMLSCRMEQRGLWHSLRDTDCIVPVPTSRRAFHRRGFHHTALLANLLSQAWGIPWERGSLTASTPLVPQASLDDWRERQRNVQDIFSVRGKRMYGKKVLLLDDVLTTGATLCEAGHTLLKAGAKEVNAVSICRAPGYYRYRREAVMGVYQKQVV